ncbi:hypothetical protein SNE40_002604 [Patella caerulea]|uniref:Potassium channel domain-containing protein n=1 Tax=Patella caerulea TaxID=87958 RepID=A0AAN8KG65_PATCE
MNGRPTNTRRKPRREPKKGKKKKQSSSCCCCCADKVADTDAANESDSPPPASPSLELDSEQEVTTGCCCCRKKKKVKVKSESKCGKCCRKLTTFMFSHIGLCSLVVAYSVLGGYAFMLLESPHEVIERNNVELIRKEQVERLWNVTKELNVFYEKNWTIIADEVFKFFQDEVFLATKEKGWDGKDGDKELQWSFAGALLYSVTVITTIGYGHIAPKTFYGRLVTIFYALVGIPLTLLCLANMGSFLSTCFRCLYKHSCNALLWFCCPQHMRRDRPKNRSRSKYSRRREPPSVEEDPLQDKVDDNGEVIVTIERETEQAKEEPVRVPIFISLMIIAGYIFGGAVIFSLWEEKWDYLIGSYFCFVTLTTIGFGDFVPGASSATWGNKEKNIFCVFYLVFGLSLIAMCFNLMQEEVRAKFRWLGQKFGVIDKQKT